MPAVSLDTSALVKRYVPAVGSAWVRRTLARWSTIRCGIPEA